MGLYNTPTASLQWRPVYDSKQSDGEVTVMLELWGCRVPFHCHRSLVHSGPEW